MDVHELVAWIARYLMQYLANALWQLPLLAAAGWIVSRIVRRLGAGIQHRVWVATLILSGLTPLGGLRVRTAPAGVLLSAAPAVFPKQTPGSIAAGWSVFSLPPPLYWALFFVYLAFLLFAAARLTHSWRKARNLSRNSIPPELSRETAELWQECRRAFTVGDPGLRCSSSIAGPATVGDRQPCLLLPPSLLANSSREDLLAALAHECAHVERHDFLLNLLYQIAALPVAFHPAVWLTKQRLAATRELICDGMAASRIAGAHAYAHSLLSLAAAIGAEARAVPPYAIGLFDANTLENRIMNLTEGLPSLSRSKTFALRLLAISVLSVAGLSAFAFAVSVAPSSSGQAAAAESPVGKIYKPGDSAGHPCTASSPHCVIAPRLVYGPDPAFSNEARRKKFQGVCIVSLIVDTQGNAREVEVVRRLGMGLDQKAVDTVRRYKFKPATLDGKPVAVRVKVEINFKIYN